MAATNPSYYQSGVCRDIREKEHRFRLYMNQRAEGTPNATEKFVLSSGVLGLQSIALDELPIRDGPAATANLVACARGMHVSDGIIDSIWLYCHDIIFTDTRFKGSSLHMRGHFEDEKDSEWAIVGGTGEFAYARGAVTAKVIQPLTPATRRTWELRIRAFCLCISEMTKMGPWGGQGGTACDIPEPPLSLQSVTIGYGDVINSVAFSYTDQAGQKKTAGPWGGDGPLATKITLGPSETIKEVLGTAGTVGGDTIVTSLTLVRSLRTYGPFGKPSGTPLSDQVPDGQAVVGFFARAGAAVNALGVYYA